MSISSYMDCLKNTALKNPIADSANELLGKLGGIPTVGLAPDAIAALEDVKKNLQTQAEESTKWVSGVKDNLPLLKASDTANNKLKVMQGITPSAEGGSLIKGITGTLGDITQKSTEFTNTISGQINSLPTGDPTAITDFINALTTSVNDHIASVGENLSSVTSGITGAISDLKDYAFAKFSALPQPPALTELMSAILPDTCQAPRPEIVKSEEGIAREVVDKKYEQTLNPATPTSTDLFEAETVEPATNTEDIPAPVVNGKTPQEIKDSVYAQIDATYDKRKALAIETTQLLVQTRNKKYELYPDYDEVKKQAFEGNLTAKNKYDKMLAEMERIPPFTTWVEKHAEYDACEEEITRLQKLLKTWAMNNYENVPNGPPW